MPSEPMTYANWERLLRMLLEAGYRGLTHAQYARGEYAAGEKILLLRHDADLDPALGRTMRLAEVEKRLGLVSTVFLRLHDPDYNLLGYRELVRVRRLLGDGFELGLHCETVDLAAALAAALTAAPGPPPDPAELLRRDLAILGQVIGAPVAGAAPHGDMTPHNNADVFKERDAAEFGLLYQAYDQGRGFFRGWYVSNYQGNNWKRYQDGRLAESGQLGFLDYARLAAEQGPPLLTILAHPRCWHETHYLAE